MVNQKGTAPILILIAIIGVVAFLAISTSAPFKDNLLSSLFPKEASHAAGDTGFLETFDQFGAPTAPTPFKSNRFDLIFMPQDGQILDADKNAVKTGVIETAHGAHCEPPIDVSQNPLTNAGTPDTAVNANPSLNTHIINVDDSTAGNYYHNNWSEGFIQNTTPQLMFICNNHMMSVVKSGYSVSSFMPRYTFDWANRTGTISFDINIFGGGREWWDVYVTPQDEMIDNIEQINQGGHGEFFPKRAVLFSFGAANPSVEVIDNYEIVERHSLGQNYKQLFPNDPALTNPKIRRKVMLTMSNNHYTYSIQKADGTFWKALDDDFDTRPLSFDKGLVKFEHHSYNPTKDGISGYPVSEYTFHWDNIAFDGPAAPAFMAYDANLPDFAFFQGPSTTATKSLTVNIPTSDIKNPKLRGMVYSMMNFNEVDAANTAHWRQVRVNNGPWMDIPLIKNFSCCSDRGPSTFNIPINGVKQGDNIIEFKYPVSPPHTWHFENVEYSHVRILTDPPADMPPANLTGLPVPTSTPAPSSVPVPSPSPIPSAVPQSGNILGFNTQGSTLDSDDANHLNASRFLRGAAGNVTSMSVFVGNIGATPNNQYSFAIYSDNNGVPGNLIANSANGNLIPNSWNTLPISAGLSADTWYWLVYNSNGTDKQSNNFFMSTGIANAKTVFKTQTFGTWPQTFGNPSGAGTVGASISIYATVGGAGASASPVASTQPSTVPSASPAKPGDVDGNGKVDIFDYNVVLTNFGKTGTNLQGDFDKNGKVDIFDFNTLLTNFGK